MTRLRLVAVLLFFLSPGVMAGRLEIPLRVPLEPLRQALAAQLAASRSAPNVIYREGPVSYTHLTLPTILRV